MDYVTHLKPDGTYQPLREHEENVAALAGEFAAAFGAQEHGHRTGLLHDIGKYSANGQKRQRDPEHTAKVDHASAGAQLAAQLGDPFAAFAVAGHHGGLPGQGRQDERRRRNAVCSAEQMPDGRKRSFRVENRNRNSGKSSVSCVAGS